MKIIAVFDVADDEDLKNLYATLNRDQPPISTSTSVRTWFTSSGNPILSPPWYNIVTDPFVSHHTVVVPKVRIKIPPDKKDIKDGYIWVNGRKCEKVNVANASYNKCLEDILEGD